MKGSRARAGLAWLAMTCSGGWSAWGGAPAAASEDPAVRGQVLFEAHCASCHGAGGRGDGAAARELRTRPADLTRLRRGGEGEFPGERLRQVIDGRLELAGHGSREMPIWGLTFRESGREGDQEAAVAETIEDLLGYLRSIQVPAP